jgi:hypothetical protein
MFEGEEFSPGTTHDSMRGMHAQNEIMAELSHIRKCSDEQSSDISRIEKQFKEFLSERDGSTRIMMNRVSESYSCINTKADQKEVVALKRELFEVEMSHIWHHILEFYLSLFHLQSVHFNLRVVVIFLNL